jgi:hypothetical protein
MEARELPGLLPQVRRRAAVAVHLLLALLVHLALAVTVATEQHPLSLDHPLLMLVVAEERAGLRKEAAVLAAVPTVLPMELESPLLLTLVEVVAEVDSVPAAALLLAPAAPASSSLSTHWVLLRS